MPWPDYANTEEEFIQSCWMVGSYAPEETERLLMDEDTVRCAAIPEIQRMLALVVRGERFCAGWWSSMIEGGRVRRLHERLAEIESAGLVGDARSPRRRP